MKSDIDYEKDFFAWANRQAELLRSRNLAEADIEHIAEEIESMGRSELRELESRLTVLFLHLLKWQYQPSYRGNSWRYSIKEQRQKIARHLRHNPSLKSKLPEALADAYSDAILEAVKETGLDEENFPRDIPFSYEQAMAPDFWPD